MPYVDRDGVAIYYEDHGSGPPVLLTHGYAASSRMWAGQVEAFANRYRLLTWDMRGHALSDSPESQAAYSEAATVDDMAAILDQCGVDEAVLGGHSLGGFMSLAFNLKYPERVRALILLGTGPGYRNPTAREGWNKNAEARARRFEEQGLEAATGTAEVRVSRHRSAEGLARAARGMLAQFDSRVIESLPDITVPTLILVGADDEPFLNSSDYMAAKIPGARKVIIPNAGHAANIDNPEAFNAAFEGFMASL
ncbi:MAG: alpha/beta fold hydrolase [Dehalococcoidia bacterium]